MDLTTISGVVFDVAGQPKSGVAIFLVRTLKDDVVINERQIQAALSNEDGAVEFTVPRDSTVYLYGSFFINGNSCLVENTGLAVSIPDSATANLEDLPIAIVDDTIFLDTDSTLAANSDQRVASQKAIKAYVDGIPGVGPTVSESELVLSDNTTANASSSKHGFLKKLSNVASEVLDGQGAWRTIAAILGYTPVNPSSLGTAAAANTGDFDPAGAAASAQSAAISAAATDATTKANSAQSTAIATASSDATSKASTAQANAIASAASDATTKANTAQANAIAAIPAPNITIPMILSSVQVDLNEGTGAKQALFTCPATFNGVAVGGCIITNIVMKKFSGGVATALGSVGWNAGASDVIGAVAWPDDGLEATKVWNALGYDGNLSSTPLTVGYAIGSPSEVLGLAVSTPEGAALTARVDVQGYFVDASSIPISNVVGVAP